MPEPLTDAELGLDPDTMETLDPNIRAELRQSRQIRRDLEAKDAELAQARREVAFSKAGIPDTPLNTTLAQTYQGENDPAAIKAYFEGLGVDLTSTSAGTPPQPPPPNEGPSEAELAEQRRLAQVGSQGEGAAGDIPYEDALKSAPNEAALLELIANAPAGSGIAPVEVR